MASNAYTERMGELENKRRQRNDEFLSSSGLPISRPQTNQPPSGVPTGQSPKPEEDESYKDSTFYQNFDHFHKNDPYFGGVVDELTKLATGLREEVNQGYMPRPIAEQRLHQFVTDSAQHFQRNEKPLMERAQAEQNQNQIMGIINQYANQPGQEQQDNGQDVPPEGVSAEQASQMQGGQ